LWFFLFGQTVDHGIRTGIVLLFPFWLIGGFILRSAHKHVTNDTTRAFAILTQTAEMRKARLEATERSILSVRDLDVSYGPVPMQGGAIFFDGDDISGLQPEDSFLAGLVQVPGGRGIFPGLTVKENLDVAAWASRRPKAETAQAINDVFELFPNLARRVDQP